MGPKSDPETAALRKEVEELYKSLQEKQQQCADTTLTSACESIADVPKIKLITRKMMKGHLNKVNSVHYSGDSRHCVTGSLDGKLIIWDTYTGNKVQIIPLRSAWVMSVAYAPSGNFVACGGMDNMCTVYDLNNRDSSGVAKMARELAGYDGFLSSCRFLDDKTIITGSGDMKICQWDLETGRKISDFIAHNGDVVSISLSPDGNSFVTGSVDKTCRLWDIRETKPKQTFFGHTADVNSVCFHPSSHAFATGSEDKSARMFDIRSDQQIAQYKPPANSGFTSCGLSLSGRILFCGSDDNNVHMWDTLKTTHNGMLSGHENRVTSLSVAANGLAISTCSWDQNVRVWG
ncbi:guanine nucleotide-binding protein subunit beta-2 isoform X1 [Sitophilus oryzae]|uniref:Guanine nucleotide-binding protein subunit beta-2 isoform X1 n=2 Tax=Sitophilus oryzae TaxID=7048 RepID=A0A6J2YE31_SITOR|nr:guanine nucleotide-binding protein subunit beta-2 isoform X1 [Sitophilus oryzae]